RQSTARPHRRTGGRIEAAALKESVRGTSMLVDIAKLPTAENSLIHLHPSDNVAVARVPIAVGASLRIDGLALVTAEAIPAGHKVALWDIEAGEVVERYGQAIGRAKQPIGAGRHVHTHNLAFEELQL